MDVYFCKTSGIECIAVTDSNKVTTEKNILFIDTASVIEYEILVESANENTIAILYNPSTTTRQEMEESIATHCSLAKYSRIGFVFSTNEDIINQFVESRPYDDTENMEWLSGIISKYEISALDFFGCKTLLHDSWKQYYSKLIHFGSGAETHLPDTPYGYSKKVIAKSILNQDNFYNIKIFGVFDENELDTRFIKASLKRYIAKEPIQIHANKFMDFFYMQDLISAVKYYLEEEKPPKEFDCIYSKSPYTLFDLATYVNKLGDYKVKVLCGDEVGDDYVSKYHSELPIEFIGLEEGIKKVYNSLK
jgi:hypothetical protein